jgi:hypothetical protein
MIRRTRDDARRVRVVVAIVTLLVLLAAALTGIAFGVTSLRKTWREQCVVTDRELDVVIDNRKDEQRRMVHPDIITLYFGLTNGANLATIPFAELRDKLLGRIPNIADLKIERRLPNRVTITVVEREPAVRITTLKGRADSGRVADLEGVVFPFSSNVSALPVIREATATPAGKRLTGMAAAAVRLVEEAALPELADLSVLEVDTTHADYLLVTLGDYSRARIAWDRMCEDTRASRTSLTNQLTRLSKAIATRVITQPTLWHATDYGSPGRVFAKDPARSAAQ